MLLLGPAARKGLQWGLGWREELKIKIGLFDKNIYIKIMYNIFIIFAFVKTKVPSISSCIGSEV